MRVFKIFTLALAVALFWAGSALAQGPGGQSGYVQQFENGTINWQDGMVSAIGIGAPPADAVSMAQARAMAVRAATVVARRNLLEIIKGVQIDSVTTVEEYMVTDDIIVSQVSGYLQNSQVMDTAYMSDGSVEVTVGIRLRGGLFETLMPKRIEFSSSLPPSESQPQTQPQSAPPAPKSPAVQESAPAPAAPSAPAQPSAPAETLARQPAQALDVEAVYTGLLIDASSIKIRPAMSPKILDENGNEVYGSIVVSREYAIQQGIVGYAKDLAQALANPRIADNAYTVTAISASGKSNTDLVIPNDQADIVRSMGKTMNFLEQCRVMVLVQ